MRRKKKITARSKEVVNEAKDIIINSETNEDVVNFLRETLEDDFPELDISKTSLHEATDLLSVKTSKKAHTTVSADLINELDSFIRKSREKESKATKRGRKKRTKRRR